MFQKRSLERISKNTVSIIDDELSRVGLFFRIFSRVKTTKSTQKKIDSKGENYYDGKAKYLRDIIGIRVILYFPDDVSIVVNSLKRFFSIVEETIDENEETRFAPTRINLVFRLPSEYIKEFTEITADSIYDSTFELQIRTILSEGWHEVDHDLRYKCTDDWKTNNDLSRNFNGILASIETSEYTILRLFEQLSYRHYKDKNITAMIRTKFRLRFSENMISSDLEKLLTDEFIKNIFKLERNVVLECLCREKYLIPQTMENFIYVLNYCFIKDERVLKRTPELVLQELERKIN